MENVNSRPIGVVIVAFLLAMNGVLALISAFGVWGEDPITAAGMAVEIVLGVGMLALAYGVWALRSWAWLGTILVAGLSAAFSLFMLFASPGIFTVWLNLVLSSAVIIYLASPDVRGAFGSNEIGT